MDEPKVCKCGDKNCMGFLLLHEKELKEIKQKKDDMRKEHGDVTFDLRSSPSSGEIFSKFYELHVIKKD